MEYLELILGVILTVTYTWLVIRRRRKKSSFFESIFHFDIMIGMIAGLYLVVTSIYSLSNSDNKQLRIENDIELAPQLATKCLCNAGVWC